MQDNCYCTAYGVAPFRQSTMVFSGHSLQIKLILGVWAAFVLQNDNLPMQGKA